MEKMTVKETKYATDLWEMEKLLCKHKMKKKQLEMAKRSR